MMNTCKCCGIKFNERTDLIKDNNYCSILCNLDYISLQKCRNIFDIAAWKYEVARREINRLS
jgi:hypothetical protein